MSEQKSEVPECRSCGACCFSDLETYVRVWGEDHARLGDAADWMTHWVGNRCYLTIVRGRCAALVIDPEAGLFACSAYDARPLTCRDLGRGSPACRAERSAKATRAAEAMREQSSGAGRSLGYGR